MTVVLFNRHCVHITSVLV